MQKYATHHTAPHRTDTPGTSLLNSLNSLCVTSLPLASASFSPHHPHISPPSARVQSLDKTSCTATLSPRPRRRPSHPTHSTHTPGHPHRKAFCFAFMSLRLCKPPLSTALKLSIKNMHQIQKYADMSHAPHRTLTPSLLFLTTLLPMCHPQAQPPLACSLSWSWRISKRLRRFRPS